MPRTRPGQYLVVARKGRLANAGEAANVWLAPGTAWVKVPATQQDSTFEMTQETHDGIPLRFKGNVTYRITRPELAATLFDFDAEATTAISESMRQCCLGELRDQVSRMSMADCIEGRKTTLTEVVRAAVERLVAGGGNEWGVSIQSVQVAQVFIVDAGLRGQLEAGTRNEILSASKRAQLQAEETVRLATIASERRISEESLATERQRAALEEGKLALSAGLARKKEAEELETDRARAEAERARLEMRLANESAALDEEAPIRRRRNELRLEALQEELEALELEKRKAAMEVERDFAAKRAAHELQLELLPIEQLPLIAESAAKVLNNARLTVYGEESKFLGSLEPLLEMLGGALRGGDKGGPKKA